MTTVPPPFFVRLLNKFFRILGYFVADHDHLVLWVSLAFTILCSVKIAFTKQEDDIKTGYTPFGARSRDEIAAYNNYFAAKGDPIAVFLFITAKNGGSMAGLNELEEAIRVLDYIAVNITHDGHTFEELCSDFCQLNEPVRQFYNGLAMHQFSNNSLTEERITLTFPTMQVLGKELDLSPSFFGVQTNETSHAINYLKLIMMQFRANPAQGWSRDDVAQYERKISHYFHKEYVSDYLNIYAMSLTYTADEIVRTGLTIFPYLAVGFSIMSIFSIITVYYSSSKMGQWSYHKITQAVLGCVCPLLATSSALGALFWLGFRFGTILCVTPFLILAIGVDDSYLTIHSWMRITNEDPTLTKRERVSRMLVDVGPSISITSLTNFLAFIIGIYTPTPEIQLFCIGNAVAIVFDYVYQITMYSALVSITGDMEMRKESKRQQTVQWSSVRFDKYLHLLDDYSEWIASKFTAALMFFVLCIYWYTTLRGALSINIVLSPDKLVLSDSPLLQINHLRDNYVLQNYTTVNIFVQNPGDLSNPERLAQANSLIEQFESYPECLGPKFSHYFVRDYKSFLEISEEMEEASRDETGLTSSTHKEEETFTRESMNDFFSWPEFRYWNGFVRFNKTGMIERFWATVSYHGSMLGNFQSRKSMLKRWRATADSFPDLQVAVFDDYSPFIDQLETILPVTISTSACTLLCMMIVCFLFMYNVFTVVVATLSICSICIGVFGFLSMWGIDLDPISMATTIMSIGFSVDFPAHITFHYFREGLEEPDSPPSKRVARAMAAIGFPLLQCGISTILFVCCLLFVETYMSEVFVKTMVLVVFLGLIHGLVIVPVFLCALTNIYNSVFKPKVGDTSSKFSITKILTWKISPSSSEGKISSTQSSNS
ncbi:unnamed protein product [Auanema sp. JU1783]|nr:unnamed protein product [Auanema sp. JU1783]